MTTPDNAGPLLETKLYLPKLRRGLVARPRLSERLSHTRPVTVVLRVVRGVEVLIDLGPRLLERDVAFDAARADPALARHERPLEPGVDVAVGRLADTSGSSSVI